MAASTITLNPGTGGDKPLVDTLTTVDGAAAPAGSSAQMVKFGYGAAGDFKTSAAEPFGALVVNAGYSTLFYDSWSVSPIDTTDKWTVTGTAPVIANGDMTMVATASTYNAIRTKDTVRPNAGFSLVRNGIQFEAVAATGCGRFWGLGMPATTPAPAVLAQDGVGFEIDQATGNLLAVTYAAGVRTTVATLTRPADGLDHALGVYFRVTQAIWVLDGAPVASRSFPDVLVVELPALIVRQNAATFTGTPVFVNIAHLTADTSRQGYVIADPVIGTRMMRVSAAGAAMVSDASLTGHAQTFKPVTPITTLSAANTAVTLTIPVPGAGLFNYITRIRIVNVNPTATAIAAAISTLAYTTGNMPGALAWTTGNLLAAASEKVVIDEVLGQPIKSTTANTATTIVAPAIGTGGLVRITAYYYTAA